MLIDTSGLLCYLHKDESKHTDAVTLFDASPVRLIHNYVLAEFAALAAARRLPRQSTLAFVADLMDNAAVQMVWVDEAVHGAAVGLLRRRLDKTYSLCDAVSFVAMADRGITEGLTTDRHFTQEGFAALLG
ncbi:MAG: PIN domain-containing protein [Armatimonadetes bacterium]|nr:PIN domain-containing protein [Armatimonadota bacterium]